MIRALISVCLAMACASSFTVAQAPGEIHFPNDPRAVIDVQRDFGAKGDGRTDDTDALQAAFTAAATGEHMRFVYMPDGTYLVTRPIVFQPPNVSEKTGSMIGPWIYGQNRDRVVIRLQDKLEQYADASKPLEMIRGHWRADGARMNADFFDRTMVNLTLDTGDNPGAIGIKFYSNNTGLMRHVKIVGNGAIGMDLGWTDQNGPLLIDNVEIDGFAIGISTRSGINSQTLSNITVRNAREVAVRHEGQVFVFEQLKVENCPRAIESRGGMLTLVDCDLRAGGNGGENPAITLRDGYLYASRVKTSGFSKSIEAPQAPSGSLDAADIQEYSSHGVIRTSESDPARGLQVKPEPTPAWRFEPDPAKWVCANDFGAKPGDQQDDSDGIQRAIDAAAAKGATTVYILGGRRSDPNWYNLEKKLRLHGSVRHITGFGFVRLIGGHTKDEGFPDQYGGFIVEDEGDSTEPVVFSHLNVFTPYQSFGIDNRATHRPVIVEGSTPHLFGRPGSITFANNVVATVMVEKGARMYIRHLNSEARDEQMRNVNTNDGGLLWVLGFKTEMRTSKLHTLNGGKTEVLGGHIYSNQAIEDERPFATIEGEGSVMSLAGMREATFRRKPYLVVILDKTGDQPQILRTGTFPFSLLRVGQ